MRIKAINNFRLLHDVSLQLEEGTTVVVGRNNCGKVSLSDIIRKFLSELVVFGRGWNDYDFNLYLEMAGDPSQIDTRIADYERYRNLFYVAISRPKRRLALLFTHRLEPGAMATLHRWFVGHPIRDIVPTL